MSGSTTGFGMGGMVTAHVRTARGIPYATGSKVLTRLDGDFERSRNFGQRKTLWVCCTGGDATSNILRTAP